MGRGALACPASALPDWDSEEGWIDVLAAPTEAPDAVPLVIEEMTDLDNGAITNEEPSGAESGVLPITLDVEYNGDGNIAYDDSVRHLPNNILSCKRAVHNSFSHVEVSNVIASSRAYDARSESQQHQG
ncbi:hypothetical protein TRIUR3_09236 [Triticum urartu]|uniref:Uncharacterized protein n=1 Tax=Triticum urartu TaxID=4572 RepID=M7ZMP7_TRIUA|nr:hypothetical protein TRIUR3_09236 [Triticum urartu]